MWHDTNIMHINYAKTLPPNWDDIHVALRFLLWIGSSAFFLFVTTKAYISVFIERPDCQTDPILAWRWYVRIIYLSQIVELICQIYNCPINLQMTRFVSSILIKTIACHRSVSVSKVISMVLLKWLLILFEKVLPFVFVTDCKNMFVISDIDFFKYCLLQ